tara:strand:- start:275 stop:763 length:489 start_codon:yes stop_codon:yes gene_type:complete
LDIKLFKQVFLVIGISVLCGASFNALRDGGISWLAKPMEVINSVNNIDLNIDVPSVREINLETAKNLHKNGTLFVDARSEEYLEDGFIPGAINNDDTDALSDEIATLIGFDKGFVIYCSDDDCGSSEDLAYELQEYGFNNILVFKGGWKTWSESGFDIDYNE